MITLFTREEMTMLAICSLVAMAGAMVDWLLVRDDLKNLPAVEPHQLETKRWAVLMVGRVLLAAMAGGVVWLLMVDTLIPGGKAATTRILLMSVFAGFAAPDLGMALKRRIPNALLAHLPSKGPSDGDKPNS